jgi:alkaline phosphatase D
VTHLLSTDSRERLFNVIQESGAPGVIFLSGDIHYGELIKWPCVDYPLWELTSSGLTHFCGNHFKFFGSIGLGKAICETYLLLTTPNNSVGYLADLNFGLVHFNWEDEKPSVNLELRNRTGTAQVQQQIFLADLQVGRQDADSLQCGYLERRRPFFYYLESDELVNLFKRGLFLFLLRVGLLF